MSQWSSGMTMVGDMFNDRLKAKLNAIAGELSSYLRNQPGEPGREDTHVSYRSGSPHADLWWPEELGRPSSAIPRRHALCDLSRKAPSRHRRSRPDDHLRYRRPPDHRDFRLRARIHFDLRQSAWLGARCRSGLVRDRLIRASETSRGFEGIFVVTVRYKLGCELSSRSRSRRFSSSISKSRDSCATTI